MFPEIWITGFGCCSAIGLDKISSLKSLKNGVTGVTSLSNYASIFDGQLPVGQIKMSDVELKSLLQEINLKSPEYCRSTLLAALALKDLKTDINTGIKIFQDAILFNGSTTGSMKNTELVFENHYINKAMPPEYTGKTADIGVINRQLIPIFGFPQKSFTFSTACSSSSNAILSAFQMIRNGKIKSAICGGVDSLSKFTINGFNSLKNVSFDYCKPFDRDRTGLNLGEGAAYLLLETAEHAHANYRKPIAILRGGANANEIYHATGSDPEGSGAFRVMNKAIQNANLLPNDIDYIHAHGTATLDNDLAEGRAINNIFGKRALFLSSKGFTGHTLAASGVLNIVFSMLGMQANQIWENLHFESIDQEIGISPLQTRKTLSHSNVLINSFGFGGNNNSLIISKA